ncbi:MAG: sigma-70 family RNA polymerase sigma factor [Planctomycetaceae bacterium]|nr:sigma-70 family RNA polymerase sigma factor [Planctomycetaceae bacterium]
MRFAIGAVSVVDGNTSSGAETMDERVANKHLTALIEKWHASLVLFARQWIEAEAEDIVQDAFLRYLKKLRKDDPKEIENPAAWLFRVVRNESVSRVRRRNLINRHSEKIGATQKNWFEPQHEQKLDADELADKLAALPMELREVLIPRLWGNLTFEEIGNITETSQSSAHRRYHEALQILKDSFR